MVKHRSLRVVTLQRAMATNITPGQPHANSTIITQQNQCKHNSIVLRRLLHKVVVVVAGPLCFWRDLGVKVVSRKIGRILDVVASYGDIAGVGHPDLDDEGPEVEAYQRSEEL